VETSVGIPHRHLPPSGGAKKLYSEAIRSRTDKWFKHLIKSKSNPTTEAIKTVVKTNINPTAMKVGVKSFKSLKYCRVLIETGTSEETTLLGSSMRDKCGNDLEVTAPKLRNPQNGDIQRTAGYQRGGNHNDPKSRTSFETGGYRGQFHV